MLLPQTGMNIHCRQVLIFFLQTGKNLKNIPEQPLPDTSAVGNHVITP